MSNSNIAVFVVILAADVLLGLMLAFNLFGAAEWVARNYANLPRWLRLPGQDQARFYRVTGGLLLLSAAIALAWVAIRLR